MKLRLLLHGLLLAGLWGGGERTARAQLAFSAESRQIQLLLNADNAAATLRSRQLVARARQANRPAELAEGFWLLGSALRNQSRFDSSLYYGQRALTLFTQLQQAEGQANAYALLAQNYKRLADAQHVRVLTTKALALARQAVAAGRLAGQPLALSRAYLVQGIIHRDLKQHDSARVCYRRAIALSRSHPGRPSPLPVAYANYGQLLMDADRAFAPAICYFRQALPLYRQEGNRNGLEHAYRQLSWAYRRQGDPARAAAAADTCLALGRLIGDPHRLLNSLQTGYLAYKAAGQLPRALALLEEFKDSTDALANTAIASAVSSRQATYELEQKEASIQHLNQANARQRRLLWGAGLGAATLLALLGLAAWQYRTIRQTNARLHATNQTVQDNAQQLAAQAERLATLLREVHHRVKNNLAIVAGLLRLQASRLPDPEAARAVQTSQQRVEAMSLIHQGLYQTEDVTAVDMRPYVADLVHSLAAAYGFTPDDYTPLLDLDPLRLDVDVAVPLGLILNELLTNAFKHGLPHAGRQPELRVRLKTASGGSLLLEVADNGPGLDPAAGRRGSFGQRLMAALAGQLGAQLQQGPGPGTCYQLTLPGPKTAQPVTGKIPSTEPLVA